MSFPACCLSFLEESFFYHRLFSAVLPLFVVSLGSIALDREERCDCSDSGNVPGSIRWLWVHPALKLHFGSHTRLVAQFLLFCTARRPLCCVEPERASRLAYSTCGERGRPLIARKQLETIPRIRRLWGCVTPCVIDYHCVVLQ